MRSKRIQIVEDLADQKQKNAATNMENARDIWQKNLDQLNSLKDYKLEYQNKIKEKKGKIINVQLIKEYALFIEKIRQAIEHQENTTSQLEQNYKQMQVLWVIEKRKVNALSKVKTSIQKTENKIKQLHEQKQMDEFATNNFYHKK